MGWIADRTTVAVDDIFRRMNIDTDPIFTPRFRKFIKWLGYSAIPFIFNISSIIVKIWLFTKAYNLFGFEKTVIVLLVLIWAKGRA
jgi:hypothetical protein